MLVATFPLCPQNERQQRNNNFWPGILENVWAVRRCDPIIALSATDLGKSPYDIIVTISQNELQWSINDICAGIFDNLTGMDRRQTTINLSAACIGNNASDDIMSAAPKRTATVRPGSERYPAIQCIMQFLYGV
jgi:hypothetical protein